MHQDDILAQNKMVYNAISEQFAQTRKFLWDMLKPLGKYIQDGDVILDLGCGTGRLYQLFQNFQGEVGVFYTGVDVSEGQIAVAKKQFSGAHFVVGDMLSIPSENHVFDTIYCIAVFHHLPDRETRLKSLQEMRRVLKPGGRVIMTNWNLSGAWGREKVATGAYEPIGEGDFFVPWKDTDGNVLGKRWYHSFDLDELIDLFGTVGAVVEEQYYTNGKEKSNQHEGKNIVSIVRF